MKNKKAMTGGQIVTIVVVLVAFVLIAGTVTRFISKAEPKEAEILCQNSISMRAISTTQIGNADIALSPVLCKTIDRKLKGDREEIKEQLAYMMARCWWMFGEGRYEEILGDTDLLRKTFGIPKGENDCFLCYTALIDQNDIDGGVIGSPEMFQYLIDNDHRQIKGMKYLDYIQSYGGPGQAVVLDGIGGEEGYGIVFMAKNKEGGSWWSVVATTIAGVATVIGATVCVVATAGTCLVPIGVAATAVATHNVNLYLHMKEEFFSSDERDVSMVTLDHLESIKAGGCMVTDLAGE
ncbi:MAG: hypothetical protein KJ597_03785 [Nanoarchaeota archaeon]|nr:hypothetical protein [Nanoarchaeota archaeon]MBU1622667.1 hypothetical protein [Nanoarchaeota archaeon]